MGDLGPSAQYNKDLEKLPPFTDKRIEQAFLETGSIESRNLVVERNLRFARWFSHKYQAMLEREFTNLHVPYDDILGASHEGMIVARNKYDRTKNKGGKFISYAVYCMEEKVREEASRHTSFTMSRHLLSRARELDNVVRQYEKLFQNPTDAGKTARKERKAVTLQAQILEEELIDIVSLEDRLDIVNPACDVEENFELNMRREAIEKWLSNLKPQEGKVFRLYFGLGENREDPNYGIAYTKNEIGELLCISQEKVRLIITKNLNRARELKKIDDPKHAINEFLPEIKD